MTQLASFQGPEGLGASVDVSRACRHQADLWPALSSLMPSPPACGAGSCTQMVPAGPQATMGWWRKGPRRAPPIADGTMRAAFLNRTPTISTQGPIWVHFSERGMWGQQGMSTGTREPDIVPAWPCLWESSSPFLSREGKSYHPLGQE